MNTPSITPITGQEIIQAMIIEGTYPVPVEGKNIWMGYSAPDDSVTGFVYAVNLSPNASVGLTYGTIVAVEYQQVDVVIRGDEGDYQGPMKEAMRIRYMIAGSSYELNGVRMIVALPHGNIQPLGRDPLNRQNFMTSFDLTLEPSYDRSYDA